LEQNIMMKYLGLGVTCLLVASSALAQVQSAAPGSSAANHAGTGLSQTQQPQAVAPKAAGPARVIDNAAPGSAAANNAAAGYAATQAQPNAAPAPGEPDRVINSGAPGSAAANNASVGYNSTR
jgi:hypothetical protein